MQKATYTTISLDKRGDLVAIRACWSASRAGPAGEHIIVFDRKRVLGATASSPPLKQRPVKTICRFTSDIMREIMQARGMQ